jgi:uncharacterized repeat protein (TIGR02543 family)
MRFKNSWLFVVFALFLSFNLMSCGGGGSPLFWPDDNPVYSVTYDANTGTGDVPVEANDYEEGDAVTVPGSGTLTKDGHIFGGWNTAADGSGNNYQEGDEFPMGAEDVTLYAIWVKVSGLGALVVRYDATAGDAMIAALAANNYRYAATDRTTFETMSIDDLLAYDAVFYAGSSSGDSWAKAMAYLDAGGRFFIADNDLGWSNGGTTFYQTYLQSTYVSDDGSDGVLTGMDIMAGINPDISLDPWPDDFTFGAAAVEIFRAPSGNAAGVRIERNDYKAVYLAWDFDDTASADDEIAIIDIIANYLGVSRVVLFGATHFSAHTTSWLYEISTTDGSATLIGDTGYALSGIAYDPVTKKLYGTTRGGNAQLIEISTATGAGTPVGAGTGWYLNVPAFNSSGQLFAWTENGDSLARMDAATGAITTTFPHSVETASTGLAFKNNNVLYLINYDAAVYTITTTTGVATLVGSISSMAHHGDFHPVTGQYWGIDAANHTTSTKNLLVIDIDTLTLENTISTLDDLHMLAFGYR